jgi:hypothetical protein
MAKRFRWTRKTYRQAHHLSRLLNRFEFPDDQPAIVAKYFELWNRYWQDHGRDPLNEPIFLRLERFKGDEIPF